jgi:putative chitinase
MQPTVLLSALLLAGLMGMVGQGARTVVGLKKLHDLNATQPPDQATTFLASRLVISLIIGFIAGVLAALAIGLDRLTGAAGATVEVLLGLAAAGYAGADFIEGFISKAPAIAGAPGTTGGTGPAPDGTAASTGTTGTPPAGAPPPQSDQADRLIMQTSQLSTEIASLQSVLATSAAASGWSSLSAVTQVTPELVARLFVPATPLANIRNNLPHVLAGLRSYGLADRDMLLMALATIRAETEGFAPIDEMKSKYNTDKVPFDLYEPGTPKGTKLGNTQAGDGALFKGRGFIQLTGRDNYTRIGTQIGIDLVAQPPQAHHPRIAGQILAQFLANKEDDIRAALAADDLALARKLVNGGSHGLDRFKDAYSNGLALIPEGIEI